MQTATHAVIAGEKRSRLVASASTGMMAAAPAITGAPRDFEEFVKYGCGAIV